MPWPWSFWCFCFWWLCSSWCAPGFSVDKPGALQHIFEGAHGFVEGQSQEIIGHHSEGFTPFLMTLAFFILICNLIGLIPGFESPTAVPVVPLGCAICAFVYYQAQGFKHHGIALPEALHGADVVAGASSDGSDRDHQPSGPHAFADHPSLRQHVRRRHGDHGVLLPGSDRRSDYVSRACTSECRCCRPIFSSC